MLDFVAGIVDSFDYPSRPGELLVIRPYVPYIKQSETDDYLELVSRYAATHRMHVVSGLCEINNELCLCIYDGKGRYVGKQAALSPSKRYGNKFVPAEELWIFDLGFANVYLAVDDDISNDDALRVAAARGCNLVISSQFVDADNYSLQDIIDGAWWTSQKYRKFVMNATNGLCSIIAPCAITKRRSFDGFLHQPTDTPPLSSEFYSSWLKYANDTFTIRIQKSMKG
jgi:hypothetical protein